MSKPPASKILDPERVDRAWQALYPGAAVRLNAALNAARVLGLQCDLFEGWRSPQRQAWLYAQGRTRSGKIVTKADAWKSWHQFGLAVDIVFLKDGKPGAWTWEGDWTKLHAIFRSKGFETIENDKPHFQLTGGMDIAFAYGLSKSSGIPAVWPTIEDMIK